MGIMQDNLCHPYILSTTTILSDIEVQQDLHQILLYNNAAIGAHYVRFLSSPLSYFSPPPQLMQPYTHLDLLTPMPDVEMDQPRVLMLEGNLKFRDTSSKMVAHVFLFTDLLLITRAKKGGERFNIEKPVRLQNIRFLRIWGGNC